MQISEHEVTVDKAGAARQPQRRRGKGRMGLLGLLVVGGSWRWGSCRASSNTRDCRCASTRSKTVGCQ